MLFNSLDFMWFFPTVLFVFFILPRKVRMYWLLLASYYFYMSWNVKYALLMLISTVVTSLLSFYRHRKRSDQEKDYHDLLHSHQYWHTVLL